MRNQPPKSHDHQIGELRYPALIKEPMAMNIGQQSTIWKPQEHVEIWIVNREREREPDAKNVMYTCALTLKKIVSRISIWSRYVVGMYFQSRRVKLSILMSILKNKDFWNLGKFLSYIFLTYTIVWVPLQRNYQRKNFFGIFPVFRGS